jgi:hypothetical protein
VVHIDDRARDSFRLHCQVIDQHTGVRRALSELDMIHLFPHAFSIVKS